LVQPFTHYRYANQNVSNSQDWS